MKLRFAQLQGVLCYFQRYHRAVVRSNIFSEARQIRAEMLLLLAGDALNVGFGAESLKHGDNMHAPAPIVNLIAANHG